MRSVRIYRAGFRAALLHARPPLAPAFSYTEGEAYFGGGRNLALVRAPQSPAIATMHRTMRDATIRFMV